MVSLSVCEGGCCPGRYHDGCYPSHPGPAGSCARASTGGQIPILLCKVAFSVIRRYERQSFGSISTGRSVLVGPASESEDHVLVGDYQEREEDDTQDECRQESDEFHGLEVETRCPVDE